MKKLLFPALALLFCLPDLAAQESQKEIYLIVRADDIGSSHAANLACIQSYREGIARSVEIMPVCAWFPEAVRLLRENPGYDVGVHLALTSEWDNVKWRPLTQAPTLVDGNGYFFPKTRTPEGSTERIGFWDESVSLKEVEAEIRAQIELTMRNIPQVSHISGHMGCGSVTPGVRKIVDRLSREYGIDIDLTSFNVKPARWESSYQDDPQTREKKLLEMLSNLGPGLHLLIEHPALNTPEMKGHGHEGYRNVHSHRDGVTRAFCSSRVKQAIEKLDINLISYREAEQIFGKRTPAGGK